jgi:hypothetical protein
MDEANDLYPTDEPDFNVPTHSYEEEREFEKKKIRRGRIQKVFAILVAMMFVFAGMILFTTFFYPPEDSYPKGYYIKMDNPNSAEYHFIGEVKDYEANLLRDSIDRWGNEDGTVSESEIKDYEEFVRRETADGFTSMMTNSNIRGKFTYYNVYYHGASGRVESNDSFTLEVSSKIGWSSIENGVDSFHIFMRYYDGPQYDFKFIAPPGYRIVDDDGLNNVKYNSESTEITGISDVDSYVAFINLVKVT